MAISKKCAILANGDAIHVGHRYFVSRDDSDQAYYVRWARKPSGYCTILSITESVDGETTLVKLQQDASARYYRKQGYRLWRAETTIYLDCTGAPTDWQHKSLRFRLLAQRYQPKRSAATEVEAATEAEETL